MKVPVKLGLFGLGLAALYIASFATAGAVVPSHSAAAWAQSTEEHVMDSNDTQPAVSVQGLSMEQDGFLLGEISSPGMAGQEGTLAFTISDAKGTPVTDFEDSHEKKLHLIVVRTDGTEFRHVHPTLDAVGVWSLPWKWNAAGSYRVYADIVPAATGQNITLTRTVQAAGEFAPATPAPISAADTVDGYHVDLTGTLSASEQGLLTVSVSRDGESVTTLEPYLGAYGHLVALREGDLAYLHVHPEGEEPRRGAVSGPDVTFMTEAPTPGRYLLYLDFQVDGQVHTAQFVLTATGPATSAHPGEPAENSGH
ncbi:heavy-metal-associated domain-containing protein [Cryobacterium melibiosiphilum]|uniref:Heavy-metal-associated domain-containing protein n=2 Tax=Cryobacterium melibiosiphilum TaxID=995039 RepID=A0A3A5MRD9_9MICO|nr:heavy-metal-associated domain-containing protein [Cryobacterium melibiosiphilum]